MLIVISWRCFTPSHFGIVHDLMVVAASSALDLTNCIVTSWLFFSHYMEKRHIAYNLKNFLAKKISTLSTDLKKNQSTFLVCRGIVHKHLFKKLATG